MYEYLKNIIFIRFFLQINYIIITVEKKNIISNKLLFKYLNVIFLK